MITTSLERGNPATDLRLPTNVIYDTRVDGEVERMDVIEQRARDVLSGTRVRIEEPAGTQYWGPYTLLQDLAGERFELEYYEQYTGGRAGRLHLKIGPLETSGGDIGGFVRADGMNLINDSTTRLTACVFNREPVVFTLPVVPDVNVAGEWTGSGQFGAGAPSEMQMVLTQAANTVSGRIGFRARPAPAGDYDTDVKGKVNGSTVTLEFTDPDSRSGAVHLTLSSDGTLGGIVVVDPPPTAATVEFRRAQ